MSFDAPFQHPRRIAIVGGGISGMAAALLLAPTDQVTLFEAAPRLGGHARTVTAGRWGDRPVDTGFIVFNYANYPHLTRLFAELDVPVIKSDMSFGVSIGNGRLEYALRNLGGLFAQRRNLVSPSHLGMIRDILRFNAAAEDAARAAGPDLTVDGLIDRMGLGRSFRRNYLLPICGAIWSTPAGEVGGFPAQSLLRFFRNHALLSPRGQHQWWTVAGGSVQYVSRLARRLDMLGVETRLGAPVRAVRRDAQGVLIRAAGAEAERFDAVILACHSDQALAMLEDPSPAERAALSAVAYRPNRAVLHADARQMPRRRACWSSWIYRADGPASGGLASEEPADTAGVGVTYWMNRLQGIPDNDQMFVTLNPQSPIDPALIYDETSFDHPVFDAPALAAQERIAAMNGTDNTWYAGASLRYGFHEDGFASAQRIARAMRTAAQKASA